MAKIMVIDDEVDIAGNLKILLEHSGHVVETFNEVDGAIEKILKVKPEIVILDVMFPNNPAGGFDISRQIRDTEAIKDIPVVLLTGVNQELPVDFSSADIDSEWMPVQDFLEKPVDMDVLLKKIDDILAG